MQEISNKKFFKNYGIFILILLIIFAILTYFAIISKKSWNKNLGIAVQKVLDENELNRYQIGKPVEINKPITVNCAAFELYDIKEPGQKQAVIIRIITFYGPVPAVYIYNSETDETSFIGYSSLHGRIKNQLTNNKSDKRREYWQEKIPDILKK